MKLYNQLYLKLKLWFYNRFKHITIKGEGAGSSKIRRLKLSSCGRNNCIIIKKNVVLNQVSIKIFGDDNLIVIGSNNYLKKVNFVIEDSRNVIEVGAHTYIGEESLLAALEGTRLSIESECMIAGPCEIRTSDSHSLVDSSQNKRINYAQDILIGKHTWIGTGCIVLKGSVIPANCVVAAKSVVRPLEGIKAGTLIGGIPAKVIKENINWKAERI